VDRTPVAIAVEDLNGDGILDLVTANFGSNDVSVRLGLRDGTFAVE
jgi:FG-GAP repeat